jgi:DNA-binding FadR family transcriptional regulator
VAFSPEGLHRESLSQQVADQVVEFIRRSGLSEGDSLPPTRELARLFGVNTGTLREALRQLEATGGLSLRHGSGVYVGPNLDRLVMANPTSVTVSLETAVVLIRARLAIEPRIAALAAVHRSDQDVRLLREALSVASTPPDPVPHKSSKPNFHRVLARASGNQILAEIIDSLLTVHRVEQHTIRVVYSDRKKDFEQHSAIYEAVRDGDPDLSFSLTEEHLADILTVAEGALSAKDHPAGVMASRE